MKYTYALHDSSSPKIPSDLLAISLKAVFVSFSISALQLQRDVSGWACKEALASR